MFHGLTVCVRIVVSLSHLRLFRQLLMHRYSLICFVYRKKTEMKFINLVVTLKRGGDEHVAHIKHN